MTDDVRPPPSRWQFSVRLIGGDAGDGEIPVDRLVEIARLTQELVRGLARERSGRAGPGASPRQLRNATTLLLVGLHPGSTRLDFAGPQLEDELDLDYLGGEVPPEVGTQAVELLKVVLEDASGQQPQLLDDLQPSTRRHLAEFLEGLRPYPSVEVELPPNGEVEIVGFAPERVARVVRSRVQEPSRPPPDYRAVEGLLYALNLRTGTFRIEDDYGTNISFLVPEELRPSAMHLAGTRVAVSGRVELLPGAARLLDVDGVEPAPDLEGVDSARFRAANDFVQQLARIEPLLSIDELAIPDLTEDEARAFLAALGE